MTPLERELRARRLRETGLRGLVLRPRPMSDGDQRWWWRVAHLIGGALGRLLARR